MDVFNVTSNLTFAYNCLKCTVPEAVIPLEWRIVMMLNLALTAVVYLSHTLEGVKSESIVEALKAARRALSRRVLFLAAWFFSFVILLTRPQSTFLESYLQIGGIAFLAILLFFHERRGDSKKSDEKAP